MTRPAPQSQRFLKALADRLGSEPDYVLSPVIEIIPRTRNVDLSQFSDIILTSEAPLLSVEASPSLQGKKAWCVGEATAASAREKGLDALSAGDNVAELLLALQRQAPSGRVLYLRGAHVSRDIAEDPATADLNLTEVVVYDQVARPLSDEARKAIEHGPSVLPLFSTRSAKLVRDGLAEQPVNAKVIAISDAVATAWNSPGEAPLVAVRPNAPSMVDLVVVELSADSAC